MTEQSGQPPDAKQAEEKLFPPDVPLHPNAKIMVRESARNYAASVVLQAKLLAFKHNEEEVLTNDVTAALKMTIEEKNRSWKKEMAKVVGAGLFGMFIPGFMTQLSNLDTTLTAVFTIAGVAGLMMVAWGLS